MSERIKEAGGIVVDSVKRFDLGGIQTYRNLAVAPIIGKNSGLEHLVLGDAVKQGFEITEKAGGNVPILLANNKTGNYVLAIIGEFLVGGRQNRQLTRNVYFSKEFAGEIPVACVQAGRWGFGGGYASNFAVGGRSSSSHYSRKSQGEVWTSVQHSLARHSVGSGSSDLAELYAKKQKDFDEYISKFTFVNGQIGNLAVFSRKSDKVFVVDLFDREEVMKKHYGNLIRSYALEAGLDEGQTISLGDKEARGFLDSVDACIFEEQRAISSGSDFVLRGEKLEGSALLFNDEIAYLNMYTKLDGVKKEEAREPGQQVIVGFQRTLR